MCGNIGIALLTP
ncbi:hypothetical protein M2H08_20835 [Vibrio vulnificus]|nr:hypothetical protein [Vibrio vulnificus]